MNAPSCVEKSQDKVKPVEVLPVEDNPTDAALCLRALGKYNLANHVHWVNDGAEALDFLFRRGAYVAVPKNLRPKVVLLDLRPPKIDGLEMLRREALPRRPVKQNARLYFAIPRMEIDL